MPGMDYFLFTRETKWRFTDAEEPATLQFLQDFSIAYRNRENVALVPVVRGPSGHWEVASKTKVGIYWQESWQAKPR